MNSQTTKQTKVQSIMQAICLVTLTALTGEKMYYRAHWLTQLFLKGHVHNIVCV